MGTTCKVFGLTIDKSVMYGNKNKTGTGPGTHAHVPSKDTTSAQNEAFIIICHVPGIIVIRIIANTRENSGNADNVFRNSSDVIASKLYSDE